MATQSGLINLPSQPAIPQAPAVPTVAGYNASTATPVNATAKSYDPKGFAVTSDQTVQGQIKKIVDDDSPLMQQALTRATQKMNQRGLINSSINVGAGQEAVLSAALPIAQQDAKTYETANTNTVNAQNAALNFGASADNAANSQNAQAGTNVNLANTEAENKARGDAAAASNAMTTQLATAQLDANTREAISKLDNQYRQLLQSSNDATNRYNQTVQNISNISQNASMSQEAKDAAIATQMNMLKEGLRLAQEIARQDAATIDELNIEQYFSPENTTEAGTGGTGGTGGTEGTGATGGGASTPGTPSPQGTPYWVGANGQTFFNEQLAQESLTGYSLPSYTNGQLQPAGYV